jgi:hypothetical protein
VAFRAQGGYPGGLQTSPGGFEFGVQGWNWPEPQPRGITFYLDGTASVFDQFGRAIRGAMMPDGREVRFATCPPPAQFNASENKVLEALEGGPPITDPRVLLDRKSFATHAQVVKALAEERIDWWTLQVSGWPQLPYEDLKKAPRLMLSPLEELEKIRDPQLRRDALRVYYEYRAERDLEVRRLEEEAERVREQARQEADAARAG